MFDLQTLQKLKDDSLELNRILKELTIVFDDQMTNIEGMCDISQRVNKTFTLYKTLILELEEQSKDNNNTRE